MPEPLTLAQIAARLGGRVVGDAEVLISQVGSLESAAAGQIAFLANSKYRAKLATTRAAAVVLGPDAETLTDLPRLVSKNPYAYFARLSQLLNPAVRPQPGIDQILQPELERVHLGRMRHGIHVSLTRKVVRRRGQSAI